MSSERRVHVRRPLEVKVRIDGPKGRSHHTARDLSLAGVFVETTTNLTIGALVECRLELPDGGGSKRLHVTAEVRHQTNSYHTDDGRGPFRGVGLRFVRMDAEVQSDLNRILTA